MESSPPETLRVAGLSVSFPGFRLGPLDLTLHAGERLALVGANGAGKSTTLRACAGRLNTYGGSVRVGGVEVRDHLVATRTRVGVLPERLQGFGWMKAEEHLSFLSAFYPTWDHAYASDLCQALEIPLSTRVRHLSRGNRVKLALVGAEAFRPPVLLLDEPTAGVDPLMRHRLLSRVGDAVPRDGGRSMVFSTHILEDLDHLADRVVILRSGAVVAMVGIAEARRELPHAPFSAYLRERLRDA